MPLRLASLLGVMFVAACGPGAENGAAPASRSIDAKVETHEMLVDDMAAERHPSDGGGSATLASPEAVAVTVTVTVTASERRRFEILYEVGPLGIAEGGTIALQPSPFWGWDPPQVRFSDAPGYTEAATEASGVTLENAYEGGGLVAFEVMGRGLEPGERVTFVYGAGPAGARVDRYAEHRARLWISVDGDGDGVRAVVEDSPSVDVVAGEPASIVLTVPSTSPPGRTVRANVAVVDALGSAVENFSQPIELRHAPGIVTPDFVMPGAFDVGVLEPGVYRIEGTAASGLEAESNPLVVREGIPRILWADLHGHSQLSDGTGTPEDYYRYARDVAALDVVALTDHDHWGMRFLDQSPDMWNEIRESARGLEEPGRFLALVGYEWTSWLYGHRHVLYFEGEGEGEVLSSLDPRYENPRLLWDALEALEGHPAISIAHHSAGGPVSVDWTFLPDPEIEPVTEIVSVHGSSEASDTPGKIYSPVEGNFVRDVLDRGAVFGFVGSGDSHDGHPGLAHLGSPSGGLAAVFAEELSRESVLEALRARRVYATNGPRIWLRLWLDDAPMGSIVPPASRATQELRFATSTVEPVERVDVIRSGEVVGAWPGEGKREQSATFEMPRLEPGEYVYVRVVQDDGGAAWSSPIYVIDDRIR